MVLYLDCSVVSSLAGAFLSAQCTDVLQEHDLMPTSSASDHSEKQRRRTQEVLNHLRSLMRSKILDCEEKLLEKFYSSLYCLLLYAEYLNFYEIDLAFGLHKIQLLMIKNCSLPASYKNSQAISAQSA